MRNQRFRGILIAATLWIIVTLFFFFAIFCVFVNELGVVRTTRLLMNSVGVWDEDGLEVEEEGLLFLTAVQMRDVSVVQKLLTNRELNVNYVSSDGGALFILSSSFEEDDSTIEIAAKILAHPLVDPNGDGSTWPPLKMAIQRRHKNLISLLLVHPDTIQEVSSSGLRCHVLDSIPPEVAIVVHADTEDCFLKDTVHRLVQPSMSKLLARLVEKRAMGEQQDRKTRQTVEGGTTSAPLPTAPQPHVMTTPLGERSSRNAFPVLSRGTLPPRTTVMNPTPFPGLISATIYYLLGNVMVLNTWYLMLLFAVLTTVLLSSLCFGVVTLRACRAN